MKIKIHFFLLILILTSCSKPIELQKVPNEYVGDWKGKINLQLGGETNSIMHLTNDSINFTYKDFGNTYKISGVIEKIEKENKQKCESCNDAIITLYYKVINEENNDFTPYIDKMWLSNKSNGKYELMIVDKNTIGNGGITEWYRFNDKE